MNYRNSWVPDTAFVEATKDVDPDSKDAQDTVSMFDELDEGLTASVADEMRQEHRRRLTDVLRRAGLQKKGGSRFKEPQVHMRKTVC
jgi:hypothetical protein